MNEYIGSLVAGGGGSGSDPSAMHYMGPVASAQDLPSSGNNPGDTYKASANFTITQGNPAQTINVEAGDSIVWDGAIWDVYQGNIDGAVTGPSSATDGHLAVFDGASGKVIKDGGALPDKWELKAVRGGGNNSVYLVVYKNGVEYTDKLYAKTSECTFNGSGYINIGRDLTYTNQGHRMTYDMYSSGSPTMYLGVSFYLDSDRTEYLFSSSITVTQTAASISNSDYRFVKSDQIYNYSEDKSNKVTSITDQSTDTQYPSALAVKTYVDNNGFNPSSMPLVTDPVTLDTSDIWEIHQLSQDGISFTFNIYKNRIEQTTGTFYYKFYAASPNGGTYLRGSGLLGKFSNLWCPSVSNIGRDGYYRFELYSDSGYTNLLGVTSGLIEIYTNVSINNFDHRVVTSHDLYKYSEDKSNKVTSLSSDSTDTQYPSAKCVYDIVGNIETLLAQI